MVLSIGLSKYQLPLPPSGQTKIILCKSDVDERFYAYYPYIWTYIMLRDTKGNAPGNQNNIVFSFSVGS